MLRVFGTTAVSLLLVTVMVSAGATEPAPGDKDVPAPSVAADRLELGTSSIRGNQELPKVMYIVPWKDPSLGDVTGKPVNSLIDEVLAPLDRDVFLRQTKYFDQLYGSSGEGSSEASE